MTVFITGCTHFGHAAIIRHAKRPFQSAAHMDSALIANWNATVGPEDTVYHLGDFAMGGAPAEHYLPQLNGEVICLRGNHDPEGWGPDYLRIPVGKVMAVLFHYPIEEWDGWYGNSVHFHCHTHSPQFESAPRRGNVTVEATDYRPIRLDTAVARLLKSAR